MCLDGVSSSSHAVSGLVRPTGIVVVQATNKGMTQEVMPWQPEVLCNWRSFKYLVFPVISVTIHPQVTEMRIVGIGTISELHVRQVGILKM